MRGATHGMWQTPTYNSWSTMIQRCTNPKATDYHRYGGRGILVCDRWVKFVNFLEDMGIRPSNATLDRVDSNENYCKENCRWSEILTQQRNKSNTIRVAVLGEQLTFKEISERFNIKLPTLYTWRNSGKNIGRIIEKSLS